MTTGTRPVRERESAGLHARSTWVLLGKGVQMGAGFAFWVVAARSLTLTEVGVTAAACSAVMLCTQLAILGTGSAVIVRVGRRHPVAETLDLALTIVLVAGLVVAGAYLAASASFGSAELVPGHVLGFGAVFVLAAVTGTAIIFFDQASVALGHAGGSVARYATGSGLSTGTLLLLALTVDDLSALAAFGCWALGAVGCTVVGLVQLSRWTGYRFRPAVRPREVGAMLRLGVPHQLLTLTERLTPALVPLVLAYAASPEATARWYPAWMMAWVVFTAPLSAGLVQFADGVAAPGRSARAAVAGLRWSLLAGAAIAVPMAVAGGLALEVMGEAYTGPSLATLRILLLGLLPMAVLQVYNAACRVTDRQGEAVGLGMLLAVTVCLSTALLGDEGVAAVAWGWLGTTSLAALAAGLRLPLVLRTPAPSAVFRESVSRG